MRYADVTTGMEMRVALVSKIDESAHMHYVEYLREKNLFMDFALSTGMRKRNKIDFISRRDIKEYGEVINYDGKDYLFYKRPLSFLEIYEILPSVYDDEIFKWKTNKKYQTLEATVTSGMFEYECICRNDKSGIINVRYAKCDNKHRNKVTITTIEMDDINNKRIIDAIECWKIQFTRELKGIA